MPRLFSLLILLVSVFIYSSIFHDVWESRKQVRTDIPAGYTIPSKFSRILSLGHQGILSDFLFLKVATFIGGKSGAGEILNEDDWQFVIQSLNVNTDLDPYFVDPYVLAEGVLAWDAGKPEEANQLLKKGMEYRTWDWRLPFFIGFNNFYFLKDYEEASSYIMRAAELSGSPAYLKTLGARLAYYGGKSKTALLFLEEMLAEASDPLLKKRLEVRLVALERAVLIEEALDKFKIQEGRAPKKISELVSTGYLIVLPPDPYGGKWGILKNGRVFSTSKLANAPQKKATKKEPTSQ